METSLLATKLFIPPVAPGMVSRPRLLERLQGVLNSRLTLVSAPAGFGKTTLLGQWIADGGIPTAWLSVEDSENDPARFWEYFISAIRTIHPAIGENLLPLLLSAQPPPIESVLTSLINEISTLKDSIVIVLDDYHSIQSEAVHKGLTFFLEHIPANMHVLIGTRVDPPLPLARFRGKGTLMEIGVDDLRFSREETASLLTGLGAPVMSIRDTEALSARTEGWAAGLKMAVLSLRGQKDVAAFVSGFTGSQRYVMDYLFEEVLQKQPLEVRDFLLKTSILERLSGPLCDAITGSNDGGEMLVSLEKANLFVVPLDTSGGWYRYHHLFRDLLLHQVKAESGDDGMRRIHAKASRWYHDNGYMEDAINHCLTAQDWDKAMDLISSRQVQVRAARSSTMLGWLRRIPEESLRGRVPLCMNYVWACEGAAQYDAAEDCLRYLDGVAKDDVRLQGAIAVAREFIASDVHDFRRAEEYARIALSLLPPNDRLVGLVSGPLAGIYMTQRRFAEAEPLIRMNYETIRQASSANNAVLPLVHIGLITFLKGQLHEAMRIYKEAINLGEGNPDVATACLAHLFLGDIYYEWDELEEAASQHQMAIAKYRSFRVFGSMDLDQAYLHLARTRMAMGDAQAAMEALGNADRLLSEGDNDPRRRAGNAGFHAAVALQQGDWESASDWAATLAEIEELKPIDAPGPAVRLLDLRKGRTAAAEKHQAEYDFFARQGLRTVMINQRLLQALNGDGPDNGLEFVADALAMGKKEGHVRIFVDFGKSLAPLLKEAISRGIEPEYARKLLDLIEAEERQRRLRNRDIPAAASTGGLLSERELEVLRLVAEGLSNQQIADRLTISLSTAKTHVYHLFDKLDASDRVQAIKRARELKLL